MSTTRLPKPSMVLCCPLGPVVRTKRLCNICGARLDRRAAKTVTDHRERVPLPPGTVLSLSRLTSSMRLSTR